MIPGRRGGIIESYQLYKKFGLSLLSAPPIDDPGFFLYVPLLSSALNVDSDYGAVIFVGLISFFVFISFAAAAFF